VWVSRKDVHAAIPLRIFPCSLQCYSCYTTLMDDRIRQHHKTLREKYFFWNTCVSFIKIINQLYSTRLPLLWLTYKLQLFCRSLKLSRSGHFVRPCAGQLNVHTQLSIMVRICTIYGSGAAIQHNTHQSGQGFNTYIHDLMLH
jgi:hypothetical protein